MRVRTNFASVALILAGSTSLWGSGGALPVAATFSPGSGADGSAGNDPAPDLPPHHGVQAIVARVNIRPTMRPSAAPGPCPTYGTVLVPGSQWLSGQGVDVRSNGGTGADCYSTDPGHVWQCGELVNRFLAARGWSPALGGDAAQFYDDASPAFFDKHPVGSGYLPVPGDIVVWSGGSTDPVTGQGYGHVAIVVADAGGVITLVEQNSTITGYGSIAVDGTGAMGPVGGLQPIGYLHARANPNQPPTTSSASPSAAPPRPHRPSGPSGSPSPSPSPVVAVATAQPTPTETPTASQTPVVVPTSVPSSTPTTP